MLIELNREIADNLTKTEYEIANFINENAEHLQELSIVDIAFETYSSPSTVSRAIRKCGINGFNELRTRSAKLYEDSGKYDDVAGMVDIMNKSLEEIKGLIERLSGTDILNITKMLTTAKKVYILGRGLTEYVGEEFSFKLQLLDIDAMFIRDPNIMREKAKRLGTEDIIIIFSLMGQTKELVESAEYASERNVQIVTCCCSDTSPLLKYSNVSLVGMRHKHVAIQDYEVSSRLPLQMMSRIIIDALVMNVKE